MIVITNKKKATIGLPMPKNEHSPCMSASNELFTFF